MATAEEKKVIEEKMRLRAEGLAESVRIVEENLDKITTQERDNVFITLGKAKEFAQRVGTYKELPKKENGKEEEEIKHTKKVVGDIIELFNKQLAAIQIAEKLLTIEIKLDADIENKIEQLKAAKDHDSAINLLEKIKGDAQIEKRLIETKEYNDLKNLVKEEENIMELFSTLKQLVVVLIVGENGKAKAPDDPVFIVGSEINARLQRIENIIKEDEKGELRLFMEVLKKLIETEKQFLSAIDEQKKQIEKHKETKAPVDSNQLIQIANNLSDMIKNTINQLMANATQDIRNMQATIKTINKTLNELLPLLEQAKKLAKE